MSQLTLFASPHEAGLKPSPREVLLRQILPTPDEPSSALLASVQDLGIVQAVVLVERGGRYQVIKGRRRVNAARKAGLIRIPALVYPEETEPAFVQAATLVAQKMDQVNLVSELESLDSLLEAGEVPLDRIASQLHLSRASLEKVAKLKRLIPPLYQAFTERTLAPTVAQGAASLAPERQQRLAEKLASAGHITLNDVRQAKQVRRAEEANLTLAALTLPDLAPLGGVQERRTLPSEWRASLAALDTAERLLPIAASESLRQQIRALREQLLLEAAPEVRPSTPPEPLVLA